jgi:hypothetical protein
MKLQSETPESQEISDFMVSMKKESDRGTALISAALLDTKLTEILSSFLVESKASASLLEGATAPLSTFASRASIAVALGLIQENEFSEITIIRKIRNEFGHSWKPVTFESERIASLCRKLPWLGPPGTEEKATLRSRFTLDVTILLFDLMWRRDLVAKEKRVARMWPNKMRGSAFS